MRLLPMKRAQQPAASDEKPAGLDAFASESEPAPTPGVETGAGPSKRPATLVLVLSGVIALQAIPTVLWMTNQFRTVEAAAAAPPPTPVAEASAPVVTAPCEPAPVAPPPAPARAAADVEASRAAAPAGLLAGSISIAAALPMQIYRGDKLIGTTEADNLLLPLGNHDLEFVNEAVGYRTRKTVSVQAGRPATVRVDVPRAPMHVNAVPWAEVWVDGERVGETPLGNLQQPLGTREVLLRHPQFGDRRVSVLVTAKGPARVSVDMRKP